MTGFVTLIVLFSLCAAAAYAIPAFVLPRFPDFPLQLPEIPLLFVAPIVGGLWVLVRSLPSSRPSATTGTGKN